MSEEKHKSHRHHRHRHHHHKHSSKNGRSVEIVDNQNEVNDPRYICGIVSILALQKRILLKRLSRIYDYLIFISRKVKHIIFDFRKENEGSLDDLRTQFNLLDNGYSVDLGKVTNSLLQGTLNVIFSILNLPSTNRGYFWSEEDFGGCRISELFDACLNMDLPDLEVLLKQSSVDTVKNDSNEIDLDDLEEEEEELDYGPALPTQVFTKTVEEEGQRLVGPAIPDGLN